jgi:hypothetical protein
LNKKALKDLTHLTILYLKILFYSRGMCSTCFKRSNGQKNRLKRRRTVPVFNGENGNGYV